MSAFGPPRQGERPNSCNSEAYRESQPLGPNLLVNRHVLPVFSYTRPCTPKGLCRCGVVRTSQQPPHGVPRPRPPRQRNGHNKTTCGRASWAHHGPTTCAPGWREPSPRPAGKANHMRRQERSRGPGLALPAFHHMAPSAPESFDPLETPRWTFSGRTGPCIETSMRTSG